MKNILKKFLYILLDVALSAIAMLAAFYLRFAGEIPETAMAVLPFHCGIAMTTFLFFSLCFRTYNSILDYVGFSDAFLEMGAVSGSVTVFFLMRIGNVLGASGSIAVIYGVLLYLLACGVRVVPRLLRWCKSRYAASTGEAKRVVIVGAGSTGSMLVKRLSGYADDRLYPVALIDDDKSKIGMRIGGVLVRGGVDKIAKVAENCNAEEIVMAIPSADSALVARVNAQGKKCGRPVKIFRNATDVDSFLAGDKKALKEVSIEDLLFRDVVKPDMRGVGQNFFNKVVMVTGGCGSIGSEICRQVLGYNCQKLIIFDISENGLFYLNEELKQRFDTSRYVLCIGSIRDKRRIKTIMQRYHPDIVLHAAAHKHVPMMELNPFEAIKNNVGGTKNLLECCTEEGVKKFLQISTDKAVNPTNIMGATKRITELLVQAMDGINGCEMVAVRFGNVLGSNGSVIPTFRAQIAEGGPVTVTHPDITRYFMTIPEAVSLVLLAQTQARGGELFVLDMGKPIRIADLAKDMIELSGFTPGKEIKIVYTGLRPGEKLQEELNLNTEEVDATSHDKIFVMRSHRYDGSYIAQQVESILQLAAAGSDEMRLRKDAFAFIDNANLEKHTLPNGGTTPLRGV